MISMRINGCLQMICKMLKRLLLSIGTPCLGSQGLGGGVVLSIEMLSVVYATCNIIMLDIIYLIILYYIIFYFIYILYIALVVIPFSL